MIACGSFTIRPCQLHSRMFISFLASGIECILSLAPSKSHLLIPSSFDDFDWPSFQRIPVLCLPSQPPSEAIKNSGLLTVQLSTRYDHSKGPGALEKAVSDICSLAALGRLVLGCCQRRENRFLWRLPEVHVMHSGSQKRQDTRL